VRLGLRKGCKYWLDSEEIPSKSVYRGYEIPEGYKVTDVASAQSIVSPSCGSRSSG